MRLARPLALTSALYRDALFRIDTAEKVLFLTFDDGPDPRSTPRLIQILENHGIKAAFFCTGLAADSNPDLMNRIRSGGHLVGNHGYIHLNGFRTSLKKYTENARIAADSTSSLVFRPPYGRITFSQYRALASSFKIVFWDVMPHDFDTDFGGERSFDLLCKKVRKGSVIVLHDTPDSTAHGFLEKFIFFAFSEGYRFEIPAILYQNPV